MFIIERDSYKRIHSLPTPLRSGTRRGDRERRFAWSGPHLARSRQLVVHHSADSWPTRVRSGLFATTMHLLVYNETTRCAVVLPGTATVLELKERVDKQTQGKWPVAAQDLRVRGESLADEITLAEHGIMDRERIELCHAAAAAPASDVEAELAKVIRVIDAAEEDLNGLEAKVKIAEKVHQ